MEHENLVDIFYEKLADAKNPGTVLATFFSMLMNIEVTRNHIIMFNKFVKAYGKYSTFMSILDVFAVESVNLSASLYPLFSYFLKKRFELSLSGEAVDLTSYANERARQIEGRHIDLDQIRSPFNE